VHLSLAVTRARSVTVSLDGRRVWSATPNPLADRYAVSVSARGAHPGPHVIVVRVAFAPGSGDRPVTLRRVVTVCAPTPPPRFTG
jgi:hypothetical protein